MKKLCSFRIDQDIYDCLVIASKDNHMTMTGYLSNILLKDKENKKIKNELDELNKAKGYELNIPGGMKLNINELIEYNKNKIIENIK